MHYNQISGKLPIPDSLSYIRTTECMVGTGGYRVGSLAVSGAGTAMETVRMPFGITKFCIRPVAAVAFLPRAPNRHGRYQGKSQCR